MADPGAYLMQGFQNLSNGVVQGQANYQQYQQQDAAATGSVNAFLAQNPTGAGLSSDGQALIQKQLAGNANRKDRLQLLGEINTAQTLRQNQTAQAQAQADLQQRQLENQQMQAKTAMIQKYAALANQPQQAPAQPQAQQASPYVLNNQANAAQNAGQPQGAPAGAGTTPPPLYKQPLVSMSDPAVQAMTQRMMGQIVTQNGFDFKDASDKAQAASQKYVDAQNSVEQPVGFAHAGFDPDTRQDIWQPLVGKRGGTITASGPVQKMVGNPSGPVLTQADNGEYIPLRQAMAVNNADLAPNADQIVPSEKQQALISDAKEKSLTAQGTYNLANQTYGAAQAYTQNNVGMLNAIKGTPQGQKWLAAFGSGDAQKLQALSDEMMVPQVQQLKGQGALRVSELPFLSAPLASPAKGNALIMDMADMNQQKGKFMVQRSAAYEQAVKNGWGPGTAADKAMEKVPMPNFTLLSTRKAADAAPPQAVAMLKSRPDTASYFDQHYGPGTSSYLLNQDKSVLQSAGVNP
jgi:hypothetical protein